MQLLRWEGGSGHPGSAENESRTVSQEVRFELHDGGPLLLPMHCLENVVFLCRKDTLWGNVDRAVLFGFPTGAF